VFGTEGHGEFSKRTEKNEHLTRRREGLITFDPNRGIANLLFAQLPGGSLKITYGVETMRYANKLQGLRNGETEKNKTKQNRTRGKRLKKKK